MGKRPAAELKRLNKDCNLTAGLEAVLQLVIGARVMLHSVRLVNGAIGSVTAINLPTSVTVKFDHLEREYKVEKVQSRFLVMQQFTVYRKQFPLILAYAVTIDKCQGLSLDYAMMELTDSVFSPGMAYVALLHVKTLNGLYLIAFAIIVSDLCLKEVNRLRVIQE